MMRMPLYLLLQFWLFSGLNLIGQEIPPITNFQPSAYHGGQQNWAMAQDKDGLVYVANNAGLLEFNGEQWTIYPTPNHTIMRSVGVQDGRIYSGSYMDFGYWERAQNGSLAWYHIFTTTKPSQDQQGQTFDELVWSDEFDTDGAPNSQYWSYDLGTGSNGWGNNESQYYTDRPDNVSIADGVLKITAKAESYQGSAYTSARIKTENAFEFTYGMVEIRAKLPEGAGTWPALWMLGANFSEVGWPNSGEIDIMEYAPNRGNIVSAALHYPGNSGGNAITGQTTLNDASTAFHVYKMIWTAEKIEFFVDDTRFHSIDNSADLPFNQDFFLIFNVAMGGTFGGAIAPDFAASAMEVDYVRVYQ